MRKILIILLHTSSNDHIVIALAYLHRHGYSVQLVWPLRAAKCNEQENKYFNKKIAFLQSTNFKLRQIKGNSINNGNILKICNLCQQCPLLLLAPGIKNLVMPVLIDSAYRFHHTCNFMLLEV